MVLIVPGRPGVGALTWWVLSDDANLPQLELRAGTQRVGAGFSGVPLPGPAGLGIFLVPTGGVSPDRPYTLAAQDGSCEAHSRTLPSPPLGAHQPFTIAMTSCYCVTEDAGLSASYPPSRHHPDSPDPVRLRFLGGDQLYLDFSEVDGHLLRKSAERPDPWARHLDQWRRPKYREFVSRSPNLALADDHEFWNDYPHSSAWLGWSERGRNGSQAKASDGAFSSFQAALNLAPEFVLANAGNPAAILAALQGEARTFRLDVPPLSFFLLDVRTRRKLYDDDRPRFAREDWLRQCLDWISGLGGPGVLVLAQPLVEEAAGRFKRITHTMGDVNLPDYAEDFAMLWEALFAARNDVLVVSGDIHWSRSFSISRVGGSRTVHEVISSPLARIPEVVPGWVSGIVGMNPDTDEPKGKLEWEGQAGKAYWNKRYATTETPSYTTLTFSPMAGPGAPVRVEVAAWGSGGSAVRTDEFFLERRS